MIDCQSTHGPDCWGWGPKHYDCAVREIERLRRERKEADGMSGLMAERLTQLRRIAKAATPGPWEVVGLDGYGGPYALRMPHRSGRTWYGVEGIKRREDAEYFVAMNRNTVLALLDEIERLREQLRRETERRWEGNRRFAQEYVDDMRDVLKEAARVCKDLDDEALAKENRLACGAECAAAIEDLAARMNVHWEVNHE